MKKSIIIVSIIIFFFFTKFNSTYAQIITTIAGNHVAGYAGDGVAATIAELNLPRNVVVDVIGNIYIADYYNNVIRKVNSLGVISTFAGTGAAGYTGDGGQSTDAKLNFLTGLAIDGFGNIYLSDGFDNVIRKISISGIITTIAGNGVAGYSGDGGPATMAQLNTPMGLAIDLLGDIYIAEVNNQIIRKVDNSGNISTVAGIWSNTSYSGDGGNATMACIGIPNSVAIDGASNIYISDGYHNVVRKVNASGIISTFAGDGTNGYSGDKGLATSAQLNLCSSGGVAVDFSGNLYIADFCNNVIRKVNTSGIINTIAGSGTYGYSGDGGQATSAKLFSPSGVSIDGHDNIYIADYHNNVIRKVIARENIEPVTTTILIPNIFTPNADNINDEFLIKGSNLNDFNCKIYDRWGVMLYQSTDINSGWNGKDKSGINYSDGTYFYVVTYTDNKGKVNTKNGFFQLIR